jgi:hypothetical protein
LNESGASIHLAEGGRSNRRSKFKLLFPVMPVYFSRATVKTGQLTGLKRHLSQRGSTGLLTLLQSNTAACLIGKKDSMLLQGSPDNNTNISGIEHKFGDGCQLDVYIDL